MSKYTTEVRFICESLSGLTESKGFNDIQNIINAARPHIFNFDYPIFDSDTTTPETSYKNVLETKILRHYYTREICEETYGLWKLRLCDELNMIMPYYNQLYKSALIQFDPMRDTDITKDNRHDGNNTRTDNGGVGGRDSSYLTHGHVIQNDGDNWSKYSDTPQGQLSDIADGKYLSGAENNVIDTTTTNSGTDTTITDVSRTTNNTSQFYSTDTYAEHIYGKRSGESYSKLLRDFRKTFLNIDKEVIDSLADCFFGLW